MKTKIISAVMSAMMLALASVGGITASAEESSEVSETSVIETADSEETAEPTGSSDNDSDNSETETTTSSFSEEDLMKVMAQLAENGNGTVTVDESRPDYDGDPYYDTDGNATLIKSEKIIYNTEEMQFIAVTTKDGHVFYVLINYMADNGEDNVYFLNKVDDFDLYALLYAGEEDEDGNAKFTPEQAAKAAENANGRVKNDDSSSDKFDTSETAEGETNEGNEDAPVKKAPANMGSLYLVVGVLALIGLGAGGFFLMKKKNSSGSRKPEFDPDADYDEKDNELDLFDSDDEDE